MVDLAVDNIGNALGAVNWAVKTIAAPVKALSTAARVGSYASMGVSLAVNLVEIGLHSYSFSVAATDIEKKMATLSLTCAVLQTSLTIASMVICAAFPLAAPLFMIVGFLINYIQGEIQNRLLAQDLADSSFEQFEKELAEILELLKNPNYLFDESSQSMTIVNPNMPYIDLTISKDSIVMFKHSKPFATSFLQSFVSKIDLASGSILKVAEPSNPENPPHPYSSLTLEGYSNLVTNLQHISSTYNKGVNGLSRDNQHWLNAYPKIFTPSAGPGNDLFSSVRRVNDCDKLDRSQIKQKHIEDGGIAQCLFPSSEDSFLFHDFPALAAGTTRHVMINGHPQRPTYFNPKCTQTDVGGYTYDPQNTPLAKKLDACSGKNNNRWKMRTNNYVFNKYSTAEDSSHDFYSGEKFCYLRRKVWWSTDLQERSEWQQSALQKECFNNPTHVNLDLLNSKYLLYSGGKTPIIYHFQHDAMAARLYKYKQEPYTKNKVSYTARNSTRPFEVKSSNVQSALPPYDIDLIGDGDQYIYLHGGTALNIKEQGATTGSINLLLNFSQLKIKSSSSTIKGEMNSKYNQLIISPEAETDLDKIVLRLYTVGMGVRRPVKINISTNIYQMNESITFTASLKFEKNLKINNDAILILDNLSNFPLDRLNDSVEKLVQEIRFLNNAIPNLIHNGFRINHFNLKNNYHTEKAKEEKKTTNELFQSTGWFLKEDSVNKDHFITKKNGGIIIPKIWRSSAPDDLKAVFNRMAFIGLTKTKLADLPPDIQPYFSHGEAFVFNFFDEQTKILVKQYGETEIRYWDKNDVKKCPENAIPQKVSWSGGSESYSCGAIHISPPASRVSSGRLVAVVPTLTTSIREVKEYNSTETVFDYIHRKAQEIYWINMQENTPTPSSEPPTAQSTEPSATQSTESSATQQALNKAPKMENVPLYMKLQDDAIDVNGEINGQNLVMVNDNDEMKLAIVPKEETIIAIPQNKGIVVSVKLISGDQIEIYSRGLLKDEPLSFIDQSWKKSTGKLYTPKVDAKRILPSVPLRGIFESSTQDRFVVHTTEGVAFTLDSELENPNLLGINDTYLTDRGIRNSTDIINTFRTLTEQFGKTPLTYFKMQQPDEKLSKKGIYVNSRSQKVLFIPDAYPKNGNRTAFSQEHLIVNEQKMANNGTTVVVQDTSNRMLLEIEEAQSEVGCHIATALEYSFLAKNEDELYLGVASSATQNSTKALPFINGNKLVLMPALTANDKHATRLNISPLMQKRLDEVTLAMPLDLDDYEIQPLNFIIDDSQAMPPFIVNYTQYGITNVVLKMPTTQQLSGKNIISTPINIYLEKILDDQGQYNSAFNDTVQVNGQSLDLKHLLTKAITFDLDDISARYDEEETPPTTASPIKFTQKNESNPPSN
ncbi:MAG: hypothetical protein ACRC24_04605 [Vibrionaceae bacterium]